MLAWLQRLRAKAKRPSHPTTRDERADDARRERHWWSESQNVGGPGGWGSVDPDSEFKRPRS